MPTTTNFGWTTPADTDLVKDGAAAIRTLAGNIDTSLVDLKGGTTGQVLAKNSNTDLDYAWVAVDDSNAIQNAIIDAKGDLIVGTAADTPARLAVGGTNGHILTVDSTEASGIKWAAIPSPSLNVASNTVNAEETTTSDSFGNLTTSGPEVTITTGTKVLVMCTSYIYGPNGSAGTMDFDISGATSRSATGATRLAGSNEGQGSSIGTRSTSVTYLTVTAGSNTFTAKYFKRGTSATFDNRAITVFDLGS
jgi:hypothetical protein